MSKIPDGVDAADLNVVARNVLLDGLEALGDHLPSITVVGAQAVYLRTQGAKIAGAAYTKDAGDVYRLMVGTRPRDVIASFRSLLDDPLVGEVTATGLEYLREQFGGAETPGVRLAVDALAGDIPADRIRVAAPAYISALNHLG